MDWVNEAIDKLQSEIDRLNMLNDFVHNSRHHNHGVCNQIDKTLDVLTELHDNLIDVRHENNA